MNVTKCILLIIIILNIQFYLAVCNMRHRRIDIYILLRFFVSLGERIQTLKLFKLLVITKKRKKSRKFKQLQQSILFYILKNIRLHSEQYKYNFTITSFKNKTKLNNSRCQT